MEKYKISDGERVIPNTMHACGTSLSRNKAIMRHWASLQMHSAFRGKDDCILIPGRMTGSDSKTGIVFKDIYSVTLQALCYNPTRLEDMGIQTVYRNRSLMKSKL